MTDIDEPNPAATPLISVVIPAYNRARQIAECLDSVLGQTYQNWEAIVVDDASTDQTADEVRNLAAWAPRIRLVQLETNRGAQAARNAGIRAARGEWIAFLDSDDMFLPDSLGTRMATALRDGVEVVTSDCFILEPGKALKVRGLRPLRGNVYESLLRYQGPTFPSLLVTKKALLRIGGLDEKIRRFQEWETSIRLAKRYAFGFVALPTFVYNCTAGKAMSRSIRTAGPNYEKILRKHFGAMLREAGPGYLGSHLYAVAGFYWQAGQRLKALTRLALFVFFACIDPIWLWLRVQKALRAVSRQSQ